jgi:alkanesulfonate monooxygenase SsuD/methylene tetrahydromethanopterin reductase-like flavin-dependent oxidoreductase (luciferase family)
MSDHKRTKLLPPYQEDGTTTFPLRNQPGVYLIYRERSGMLSTERELRYVGFSASDTYKALYRHFQVWNDRQADAGLRSERTVFKVRSGIKVRVIYTRTAAQARELEKALIIKHRPPSNPDKLELYELTEHGQQLATLPQDADWITDLNAAPF